MRTLTKVVMAGSTSESGVAPQEVRFSAMSAYASEGDASPRFDPRSEHIRNVLRIALRRTGTLASIFRVVNRMTGLSKLECASRVGFDRFGRPVAEGRKRQNPLKATHVDSSL
jgi:hypothetical protein